MIFKGVGYGVVMVKDKEFQKGIQRIEELIQRIEESADINAKTSAKELVQLLMDLHGVGIERIMNIVSKAGEPGRAIIDDFVCDDLVESLLLLYGLHPLDLRTRVTKALDKVRPYLHSHGGNVELIDVAEAEGVVRLRLQGSCKSCPSSAMTLKLAIEEAIYGACPDVTAIEAEGVAEQPSVPGSVSFKGKIRNREVLPSSSDNSWEEVEGLDSLPQGTVKTIEISGRLILFCRLGETFYAYSDICPGCGQVLQDAYIKTTAIVCPTCGQRYDVIRAGRGLDQPSLHLEPFPLLVEGGRAKVALPTF